mmetsp:Transcript_12949/g.32672  ORF Transcript_12949/g.32672 Transcript_12949/m.32672 type:complete len:202 (-) Transcript_12949:536-1141(-)
MNIDLALFSHVGQFGISENFQRPLEPIKDSQMRPVGILVIVIGVLVQKFQKIARHFLGKGWQKIVLRILVKDSRQMRRFVHGRQTPQSRKGDFVSFGQVFHPFHQLLEEFVANVKAVSVRVQIILSVDAHTVSSVRPKPRPIRPHSRKGSNGRTTGICVDIQRGPDSGSSAGSQQVFDKRFGNCGPQDFGIKGIHTRKFIE